MAPFQQPLSSGMTPGRWARLRELLDQCLDAPAERPLLLEKIRAEDPQLCVDLENLIAECEADLNEDLADAGAGVDFSGQQVGSYRIEREIGRGGMSTVFLAVRADDDIRLPFALKLMRDDFFQGASRKTFERERRMLVRLNHPNIARLIDWGTIPGGLLYLVIEYVDGDPVTDYAKRHALGLNARLQLFQQICAAVGHAHRYHIVHRDLKPDNILVNSDGLVKLLDFGIAASVEGQGTSTTIYRRLTPSYASPEQMLGSPTGPASDIYSLGVILYELLTGHPPHPVSPEGAVETSQPPVPPSRIAPHLSPELDRVILKALAISPESRWPSVDEFASQLDHLSFDKPPVTARTRASRFKVITVMSLVATGLLLTLAWRYFHSGSHGRSYPGMLYPVTPETEFAAYPTLSPLADQIAYASDRQSDGPLHIWLRRKTDHAAVRLSSGMANDMDPDFSFDGKWIAFHSERNPRGVYMVASSGGPEQFLAPFGQSPRFSPVDHTLVYWVADPHTRFGSVWKIRLDHARDPVRLAANFEDAQNPIWTPDGSSLLLWGTRSANGGPPESFDLWVVPENGSLAIKTGILPLLARSHLDPRLLTLRSTSLRWLDDGLLLAASRNGVPGLWVIPISRHTWKAIGSPYPFSEAPGHVFHPAVSRSTSAFARTKVDVGIWSLALDPESAEVRGPLAQLTKGAFEHFMPSASLDGNTIVFVGMRMGQTKAYTLDAKTGDEQLLHGQTIDTNRVKLSGDGRYAFWRSLEGKAPERQAIYRMNLRTGKQERVCADCGGPDSASFDGGLVLYENGSTTTRIGVLRPTSGEHHDFIRHAYHPILSARISADGRWVAFALDRGQDGKQLFVAPFLDSGPIPEGDWVPITTSGEIAEEPAWSPGGHWIYFFDRNDGFRCLRARRWDSRTGKPSGDPIWVQHFHNARRTPLLLIDRDSRYIGLSVARDRLFLSMSQFESRIWQADLTTGGRPMPGTDMILHSGQ